MGLKEQKEPSYFLEEILGGASCFFCFASRKTPLQSRMFDSRPVMAQPQASIPCPPLAIIQTREALNQGHWFSDKQSAESEFCESGLYDSPLPFSSPKNYPSQHPCNFHQPVPTSCPILSSPRDTVPQSTPPQRRTCPSPSDSAPPCGGPAEERPPTPLHFGPLPTPPHESFPARPSAPQAPAARPRAQLRGAPPPLGMLAPLARGGA